MSGWSVTLLTAVAELLHDAGVGAWAPSSTTTSTSSGSAAITVLRLPPDPDRVICLDTYPVPAAALLPGLGLDVIGVQVRTRGPADDPRVAADLADACYEVLHGLSMRTLGDIPVSQIWWQSGAPLGPDERGRAERSSNYYAWAGRPTLNDEGNNDG